MKKKSVNIVRFHAHIYYDTSTRAAAARVRQRLAARFAVQLGSWHEGPAGPHTKAMYQVVFSPSQFGEVVPWLMMNREGLDVLVHPQTGDSPRDHLEHSLWLGNKLKLKLG